MNDQDPHKARVLLAQLRPYLPLLAAVALLLALWMAWSGWEQTQDTTRREALSRNRDTVVQLTEKTLQGELARLGERLASPPMQAALAAGDLQRASVLLGRDWNHLEEAVMLPPDLLPAYGALPQSGFGRLAVAEAALSEDRAVMRIIRDGGAPRVVLASPARVDAATVGVALVRLPLARATIGLDAVTIEDDTYLALRQGSVSLLERGDTEYADAAERMVKPVSGTGLRVAAAVPTPSINPFGLDALPSLVASVILALLAYVLWRLPRRIHDPRITVHDAGAPTLEQALVTAPQVQGEKTIDVRDAPKAAPVRIDRGIFRAYDIRGIVGQTLDIGVAELIGHAIGSLMQDRGHNDIVVGRDGRLSGPDMVAGLVQGLRRAG
ncbi:MAG TPA: phosphomannomutase/phosphoglucomutase, partial [Luteimonas sp.]|nr:phosphomannomutase/phosphoglucomutase [Luteimonas sp.]